MTNDNLIKNIVREVVKEEVLPLENRLDKKFEIFKQDILLSIKSFNEQLFARFDKIYNEIITSNDKLAGEIKTMREEQSLLNARSAKINQIENEVELLKRTVQI